MTIETLKRRTIYNCDVSDARYAGTYSVCGLVMRLRDLYKWERRLPPWQEDASPKVLQWIGDKETRWEGLMDSVFCSLVVDELVFDAFDIKAVNQTVNPMGLYYGAGYAHGLKPTFFLADVEIRQVIDGRTVWVLGREHARDLLTLPAFVQDSQVVLRTEAGRMFLWDQIIYTGNSGRRALDFGLQACGLSDRQPETLQRYFDDIWNVQKNIYIQHELGELEESVFDREIWQAMLADFPHTAVELFIRALKDLLADTNSKGALTHIIEHQNKAGLGLYVAFANGMIRMLTKALTSAFETFTNDSDWNCISAALDVVHAQVTEHTRRVIDVYRQGQRREGTKWSQNTIEAIMRDFGFIKR